ncbi:MAG: response regulator transcription factor [Nocardioides sp.]|nr:response regulator transcription factor [Nocardioides sp.]
MSPQDVVRHGLVALLGRHPDRVTVVSNPDGGEPDVVVFDVVELADGDLSGLKELLASSPAKVLAMDRDLRPDLAARALALGADGLFSMGVSESELLAAVEAAASGKHARARAGEHEAELRLGAQVGLTAREVQVLTMIAQGHTNREIAEALYLSPNSIKTYVRTAYRKIGATSRSQAVGWAIRHGFPVDRPATG